jgi:signal transduction histidine kinase/DNA-binding response OmpR family regulator
VRSPTLARSLTLSLVGLTLALAVIGGLGVGNLFEARQRYDDELARSYRLETAAAGVVATSVAHRAAVAASRDDARRRRAEAEASAAVERLRRLAATDGPSRRIAAAPAATPGEARELADAIAARQRARREDARERARSDSRRALVTVGAAGGLALLAALALAAGLIGRMRRPLAALVAQTRRLAAGERAEPVSAGGPGELRELEESFNAMGRQLEAAHARLEEERRRLEVTIESLGDALVVCDADGRVEMLNPRALDLLPSVQVGGRADDPASPLPPVEEAMAREVTIECEGRSLAATAAPLAEEGRGGAVWTVRDISERARLDRLRSEFVATASHELRSPLTSIKGFAELLANASGLDERAREYSEVILLSADRMVDLVNDLLDVASIEAGRVSIRRRPVDLGEAVQEVARLMAPRLEAKRQRLAVEVGERVPPAYADPGRVRQVLTNLVTNAHLYTGEGGELGVSLAAEDGMVRLAISDTGRGMTPQEAAQVFERFYRAGEPGVPGTGLGLSIVRSLVDLHGGTIDVDSQPGEGTTFTVRLPQALEASAPEVAAAIRGKRVLVVDDEPEIARLIAAQIEPLGAQVVTVNAGAEAIERLRAERFDAVTLDVLMPEVDGFEVLRAIRSDPQIERVPVVVVSVFSDRATLGGEWVVSKPIDAEELTYALGSAVLAGRARVLVVGRESLRDELGATLDELGIAYEWTSGGIAAAEACRAQRFEAALVDAGLRNARAVVRTLDLRGRRRERGVIVFSAGDAAPGVAKLDPDPIPFAAAARSVLDALAHGEDDYA